MARNNNDLDPITITIDTRFKSKTPRLFFKYRVGYSIPMFTGFAIMFMSTLGKGLFLSTSERADIPVLAGWYLFNNEKKVQLYSG